MHIVAVVLSVPNHAGLHRFRMECKQKRDMGDTSTRYWTPSAPAQSNRCHLIVDPPPSLTISLSLFPTPAEAYHVLVGDLRAWKGRDPQLRLCEHSPAR